MNYIMTKLSVNINKIATLRNSRGGNNPDVVKAAIDAQMFGADGITVHPRPDERHIRYNDVRAISQIIKTEFNIEGNCIELRFVDLVLEVKPHQVTLVPDSLNQITSNHGWDTIGEQDYLRILYRYLRPPASGYPFLWIRWRLPYAAPGIPVRTGSSYTRNRMRNASRQIGKQQSVLLWLRLRWPKSCGLVSMQAMIWTCRTFPFLPPASRRCRKYRSVMR